MPGPLSVLRALRAVSSSEIDTGSAAAELCQEYCDVGSTGRLEQECCCALGNQRRGSRMSFSVMSKY